jgi:hypothetical protein
VWLGHDIGWWGFVLAVVTLVLAYPLDMLAHLTSPIVKDWWAARSREALKRRIAKLREYQEDAQKVEEMTVGEDLIVTTLSMQMRYMALALQTVLTLASLILAVLWNGEQPWRLDVVMVLILAASWYNMWRSGRNWRFVDEFHGKMSPVMRFGMEKRLKKLAEEFEAKYGKL